ncbi:Bcr/CflA family efflux MFS transporter [Defluviimonas sp. WL0024]|uniref:Bcr/CflA family efflux transporter n=2 Tax=Albidovulum TaxID=205889 RepID=A0ABT3IZ93_9RHOB|nr:MULTISPECIES: Bcr/CflA family efflux MFS transporter [Defluviimonas]MCU9849656.1 Bcr/CflA family efflux MFS transporter [Defluviimonas sp. WL0024]MCW3780743.1 Bcr/CflA family efflux MFS transporter [Defluviimonas salinarum]
MSPDARRPEIRFLDRSTPPHIVTLVMVAGLSALAMNIFLPSLPGMTEWFATDYRLMQLSVSLYLAASAVLQIAIGPISDRFGRRSVLLWSVGLFLVATLGTLLAPNVGVFLFFRMMQAVVAAGMVLSRAVIRDMVPGEQAASMIGYVTMGMSVVPMVGPVVGGVLDEAFGWQANFALLIVLGVSVLWLVWADLGETAAGHTARFADQVRQYPELLTSPRFWGYCLAAAFTSGTFFAYLGGAPYVGSEIYRMPPSLLGLYFAAPAIGYAAGNYISGRYSVAVGLNRMVLAGTAITTAGMLLLAALDLAGLAGANAFFGLTIAVGIGNGMALPNANAGMLSVRPGLAGTASGLGGAIMIGGGAALSALAGWALGLGGGALPLIGLMLLSSAASVVCILLVIRRARRIGA